MSKVNTKIEKTDHWKTHFDYEYLGSHNLKEGEEVIVEIEKVVDEKVFVPGENAEKVKLVVHFRGQEDYKMILNVTNAKTLERLFSTPNVSEWPGRKIQIYAADVNAFGQSMKALRIRDFLPKETIDNTAALNKLKKAKTKEELKTAFSKLSKAEMFDTEVMALKDSLKTSLS